MFVWNGMPHVQRAINSILTQDYDNWEFVIQDGGSTDGTVEFIRGLNDPRIKLLSERDDGPADAFARAVGRCSGDILASCLYDEELVPGCLKRVVQIFEEHPYLGAVTGDAHVTDIWGDIHAKFTGAPFNMIKYLKGEYCPYWCSSFFSVSALRFVGVLGQRWSKASLEFEIWVRLAMETDILYVPEIFSKYAHHEKQLSQSGGRAAEEMAARLEILRERMFGPGKYFGENYGLRDVFCLLQLKNLFNHFMVWDKAEAQVVLQRIIDADYLREFNLHQPEWGAQSSTSFTPTPSPLVEHMIVAPSPSVTQLVTPAQEVIVVTEQRHPAFSAAASLPEFRTLSGQEIPMSEFIVPRSTVVGKVYSTFTPRFIRMAIPRDLKIKLAKGLGLRKD